MVEKLLNIEQIFIENLFKFKLQIMGQFGDALDIVQKP